MVNMMLLPHPPHHNVRGWGEAVGAGGVGSLQSDTGTRGEEATRMSRNREVDMDKMNRTRKNNV